MAVSLSWDDFAKDSITDTRRKGYSVRNLIQDMHYNVTVPEFICPKLDCKYMHWGLYEVKRIKD
jgi:hypothetical protein